MSKCKIDSCSSIKTRARGLCVKHWNLEQYGNCINGCIQPASNSHGLCTNCNKRGNNPPKTRRDGKCSKCGLVLNSELRCPSCRIKSRKGEALKRKYGITLAQWENILMSQGGVCKICSSDSPRFVVDHDHNCCKDKNTCGKCIRGIICENCNRALGLIKDSKETLKSMIEYLGDKV